ncbi:Sortilin [Oryzias melastigma]|nr:Sortilin [Oryzias melastigma]
MVIIAILLTSALAGVWLVKKYVCGGRFLVHRYSVMRENVEANKIEGVDDVDTQYMETAKTQFNEDSDQDLLD